MATLFGVFGVVSTTQAQEITAELEEVTVTAEQEQSKKLAKLRKIAELFKKS
ncbi:hypothetical protein appser4_19860 [Actinobacillus pleuropneumoniae serovar 4 str. M62]|nr:hypothetical protein appser4_19860 [Actinobacillus pleuropneumoniae serovar 4 str. M62]EFM95351.1 hypothetical protein appser10_20370 [Actinobacillus pleuropneumoniae serovar 10 str. D13039]